MGLAKLAIKLIEDPKARNVKFSKRKKGLRKKAYEFATLCDVDTCLICYKKDSGQLITWPENQSALERIIQRYLMATKEEKVKREIGLSLLDGKKLARGTNQQPMFPTWDDRLNNWSVPALRKLASTLDEKIEIVSQKRQLLRSSNTCSVQSSQQGAVSKSNFPLQPFPSQQVAVSKSNFPLQPFPSQQGAVSKSNFPLQPFPLSFVKPEEQHYSINDFLHNQATFETIVMPNPIPHSGKFIDTNNFSGMSTHALFSQESSKSKIPPFNPEGGIPTLPLLKQESSTSAVPLFNKEIVVMPGMNPMMLGQGSEWGGHGGSTMFPQQQWFQGNQYFE